jgi:hypothetical protein
MGKAEVEAAISAVERLSNIFRASGDYVDGDTNLV